LAVEIVKIILLLDKSFARMAPCSIFCTWGYNTCANVNDIRYD